jgi:hypothetical protein
MKTVDEYLHDPRILSDPDMAEALEPVKEIHAARLMLQDETAHMTTAEKVEFLNNNAKAFLSGLGLPPVLVNREGQGKLKKREAAV